MNNATVESALKQKLLIIEDEGEMCLLINLLLDSKDLEVEHVKTISDAVEYFQQQPPSIVLLDNRLPDGFGLDFLSYIKENYPATKVIMISGIDVAAGDVALESGADLFLEKPFTKTQLCKAIEDLTGQRC
ncbi:response regulator [Chitinophaga agrisoli]|uniref:Response regulator n=1 Tax=Chitinophaga agrisoli TaxID=2607653 RepID=A0A5B2VVJ6_9BACT|nr:response regulator [Chitinophaga agrisoli]KAA2242588.1 response regulator [Chitinophaga agrisoli]